MKQLIHILSASAFACFAIRAAEVTVPSAPPPSFADTESATNAPLGTALATARFLRVELSLDATPSNNIEWAFSRDWTDLRLTVRGVDERDESVSVRIGTDPGVIMLR